MKTIYFLLAFLPFYCEAQIITTFGGSGSTAGFSGDGGPATAAMMSETFGLVRDAAGNFYVSDFSNNRIRKIDVNGIITTYAGNGIADHLGDGGPATAASLDGPTELAIYKGNIYISELNSSYVRKVDTAGIITTIAGIGTNGYSGDGGPATAAQISSPYGIGVDNFGNVYIPDQSTHRIRRVDTFGIITTFAGTGAAGFSGDGGPATAAEIHLADDIKADSSGNIYFCDFLNNAVRKVDALGIITTIAGTGIGGYSGDGGPATAAQLQGPAAVYPAINGDIYISDADNHRIRKIDSAGTITTIAGTGTSGFSGDGGLAIHAELNRSNDMVIDSIGNIYFCDVNNHRVRMISAGSSVLAVSRITPIYEVDLYPSPAKELLTIKCSELIKEISINNMEGKVVFTKCCSTHKVQVNIDCLPPGLYVAKINGITAKMFVIE